MEERESLLRSMYNIMHHMCDEMAYAEWIEYVPDEPSEDELLMIAEDEDMFRKTLDKFCTIIKRYSESGLWSV